MTSTTLWETTYEKAVQFTTINKDYTSTFTTKYRKEFHIHYAGGFKWAAC